MSVRTVTRDDFIAAMKSQGVDRGDVVFICPRCGTRQTANELIKAGAGESLEEVSGYEGFSCIGRFTDEKGCDWTLGGLLQAHKLEVVYQGKSHPIFELENLRAENFGGAA